MKSFTLPMVTFVTIRQLSDTLILLLSCITALYSRQTSHLRHRPLSLALSFILRCEYLFRINDVSPLQLLVSVSFDN